MIAIMPLLCECDCESLCARVRTCVCLYSRHTRLSSHSPTPPGFSFILLGGHQQPVHAGVCGVMCVRKNGKKTKK